MERTAQRPRVFVVVSLYKIVLKKNYILKIKTFWTGRWDMLFFFFLAEFIILINGILQVGACCNFQVSFTIRHGVPSLDLESILILRSDVGRSIILV